LHKILKEREWEKERKRDLPKKVNLYKCKLINFEEGKKQNNTRQQKFLIIRSACCQNEVVT